jgi:hypothetical protein
MPFIQKTSCIRKLDYVLLNNNSQPQKKVFIIPGWIDGCVGGQMGGRTDGM